MRPYERLRGKAPHYAHYDDRIEVDGTIETGRFFIYRQPLEKTRPFFDNVLENISHIAATVQGHGGRFVLVVYPRYHHWNSEESPDNWDAELYTIGEPFQFEYFRFFEDVESEVDYEILSLLPVFQESDNYPMVCSADPHWNERGHAFVAELMADYLVTNRLLE